LDHDVKNDVTHVRFQSRHIAPPNASVTHAARLIDPRFWSRYNPELFSKSYRIQYDSIFIQDRYADPDPHPNNDDPNGDDGQGGWEGHFFESAQVTFDSVPLLTGRTVLNVKMDVKRNDGAGHAVERQPRDTGNSNDSFGSASCVYSLHEALTNNVLCFLSPSGPDVDSGPGPTTDNAGFYNVVLAKAKGAHERASAKLPDKDELSNLPNVYVGDMVGTTRVQENDTIITCTAGKRVRFSKECFFSAEQNAIALPVWSLGIISGLIRLIAR
jgi:hypothetical protein